MTQEPKIFPYIEHLLQGAEVVWKPLGEIAEYEQPTKYLVKSSNYKDIYPTPVLTAGKTFILGYTDETEGIYKASISPVIIFDDFTTANKWVDFDFKAKSSAMKMITSKNEEEVSLKYIYYWLNTLPSELIEGDHKRQWISNYANKKIPLPPLSVQQEIVRILDKFTQLEAELDCRKRQYEYYRNKLLSYERNEVEWKTLGEVLLSIKTGLNPRQFFTLNTSDANHYYITIRELKDGKIIPSDKTDKINDEALKLCQKRSNLEVGDILFSGTGTIGETAIIKEKPINWNIKEGVYSLKPNHSMITSGYVRHILSSQKIKDKIISKSAGGTVKSIPMKELQQVQIPLPPLEEQQRIASILDKFDTLVNSISEGLPKEIALRRKQYEYYREKLLSFPS
ncbi:restriction endonuclease subunit S [Capnocytophaga sp. G2]|uniref:restriction endonuclease subunit S n=1 Tax=Capnocytophaga sp. G2 TaxID=3110695 RepID=UPI002B45CFDE|nr:restriction endonuclease subunit S [Capnocytophaga sp. G2]MEB3003830.1 restriction endonuclease subunit S [Capnocytophaga sp. G2]